jgi:hypothetical protein
MSTIYNSQLDFNFEPAARKIVDLISDSWGSPVSMVRGCGNVFYPPRLQNPERVLFCF